MVQPSAAQGTPPILHRPRSGRPAPSPCRAPPEPPHGPRPHEHQPKTLRARPAAPVRWVPSGSRSARPAAPRCPP
eukprot:4758341-Prymnesium_polylepis.1